MKKWFCLLVAVFVFASVSITLAEEPQDLTLGDVQESQKPVDSDFIYVPFGISADTPASDIRELWEQSGYVSITGDPVWDEKTLSSGTSFKELSLAGESPNGFQLEVKYYFNSDSMLVASSQVYTITQETDVPKPREAMTNSFGAPKALRLERIGDYAELFGETCHLEEGQDMWNYTTRLKTPDVTATAEIVLTMREIDNKVYLAAFVDPEAGRKTVAGGVNTEDLQGYKELTPEQQQAVDLYAEYLDAQLKEEIEKYIGFLKNKQGQ